MIGYIIIYSHWLIKLRTGIIMNLERHRDACQGTKQQKQPGRTTQHNVDKISLHTCALRSDPAVPGNVLGRPGHGTLGISQPI